MGRALHGKDIGQFLDLKKVAHSFNSGTSIPHFSSVQLLSRVQLLMKPWTAAGQASLSITISQSLLKPCPLSRRCHPTISSFVVPFYLQSFPASGSFSVNQFTSGGQRIRASASASVLPMNIQGGFPFGLNGLISLQCKRLSRVFNTTVTLLKC